MLEQFAPAASPVEDAAFVRSFAAEEKNPQPFLDYAAAIEAAAACLVPGNFPEGRELKDGELRPLGQCDAVFFLDRLADFANVTLVPSGRREAMRYLRPLPDLQRLKAARAISARHPDPNYLGVAVPSGLEMPWLKELHARAEASGRALKWLFTADARGIDANKPEHRLRWRCYQVAEDVWAVLYV